MVLQTPLRSVTIKSEKQMNDPAEKVTAIKPAPRQKSQETILKQEIRQLTKQLSINAKKIAAFKVLKKEMDGIEAEQREFNRALTDSKAALIKELGLD